MFPPKEIQHRALHRRSDRDLVPMPSIPPGLKIVKRDSVLELRWTDHGIVGAAMIVAAVWLGLMVWGSLARLVDKIVYTVLVTALAAIGIYQSRRRARAWIGNRVVRGSAAIIELADIVRVDGEHGQLRVVTRDDVVHLLASARDPRITDYLAAVIEERVAAIDRAVDEMVDGERDQRGPPQTGGGLTT